MNTIVFQAHALALHICSKVLQEAPDESFLAEVREQRLFATWPLTPASEEAAAALTELDREYGSKAGDTASLRLDHLALFSGPAPAARPWESVWREKDNLLFGEQTMLVRERYAEWGLVVENFGHEPEDHIAFELAFCVHLLHRMAVGENSAVKALAAFPDGHLLEWVEPCLRKASVSASEEFYRHMPLLCLDAVKSLRGALSDKKRVKTVVPCSTKKKSECSTC
ncbi:MAG: molecular chaperone TorD family protein [Desulfovibrio sp.]|jgi:TorA maturation chaperone TorD|nr:molecular chaperone TorD family protein [Desulfovibrio sp.]